MTAKGKCIYPNLRQSPENNTSAKKIISLLIAYTQYTRRVRFYLPLPISITVSIFTVSALIFLTLNSNIPILI